MAPCYSLLSQNISMLPRQRLTTTPTLPERIKDDGLFIVAARVSLVKKKLKSSSLFIVW